ncbi:MAG: hypothetical protein K9K21_00725 [Desulfotignum sp.]|nr:hypothetical protein [Desulfotignum sp.]MCF8112354.1 hypothetical protein [Desulfotignum sp.]MCF8124608.1 hypothetical protein [Desulfotignum sp.]
MDILCRTSPEVVTREKNITGSGSAPAIVCRNCNHHVTDPDQQIKMDGSFLHTFANPHGHVFEIGCFNRAKGCVRASAPSVEFTWFAGYAWEIGICANCAVHLGWIFTSKQHCFFGLILERLVLP